MTTTLITSQPAPNLTDDEAAALVAMSAQISRAPRGTLSFLAKIARKPILRVTEAFRTGEFAARTEIYTHTNHVQRLRHHKQAHTELTTAGTPGLAPPPTRTHIHIRDRRRSQLRLRATDD